MLLSTYRNLLPYPMRCIAIKTCNIKKWCCLGFSFSLTTKLDSQHTMQNSICCNHFAETKKWGSWVHLHYPFFIHCSLKQKSLWRYFKCILNVIKIIFAIRIIYKKWHGSFYHIFIIVIFILLHTNIEYAWKYITTVVLTIIVTPFYDTMRHQNILHSLFSHLLQWVVYHYTVCLFARL